MKKFIFALIFILILSFLSFAQEENLPCPTINVEGPVTVVEPGDVILFTAVISHDAQKYDYEIEWSVNQGTIISGQKTSTMRVATTEEMNETMMEATVKIKGLPEKCNNTSTGLTPIVATAIGCGGMPADSFGDISPEQKYARIDSFLVALQNNPGTKGYILFEVKKDENLRLTKNRVLNFFRHVKFRKFNVDRILFDVCRNEEPRTAFWFVLEGAEIPKPEKCEKVDIDLD